MTAHGFLGYIFKILQEICIPWLGLTVHFVPCTSGYFHEIWVLHMISYTLIMLSVHVCNEPNALHSWTANQYRQWMNQCGKNLLSHFSLVGGCQCIRNTQGCAHVISCPMFSIDSEYNVRNLVGLSREAVLLTSFYALISSYQLNKIVHFTISEQP